MTLDENKRILVFTTKACLRILAEARGVGIDGTFKSAPKGWTQILIISAEVTKDCWVPVIYIWLPNKLEDTYIMAFNMVKSCLSNIGVKKLSALYCIMDFEVALRNSFQKVFGKKISLKGCHFHFGQSLWRYVQNNGMRIPFCTKGNECLVDLVRSAIALAFVPLGRFKEAFGVLKKKSKAMPKKFQKFGSSFIKYLEDWWVNGNYPIETWNFNFFDGTSNNNFNEGKFKMFDSFFVNFTHNLLVKRP